MIKRFLYALVLSGVVIIWGLFHVIFSQIYDTIEISAAPSALGTPLLILCNGSEKTIISADRMRVRYTPLPICYYKYNIIATKYDKVGVLSYQDKSNVNSMSVKLVDSNDKVIYEWPASSFRPMTLGEAKNCIPFDKKKEIMLNLASIINCPKFNESPPIYMPKQAWITILLPILFYILIIIIERRIPWFLEFYEEFLMRPFPFGKDIASIYLWISCFGITAGLSCLSWMLFGIHYITADDPLMTMIAKGYLTHIPDDHLVYINILVGFVFKCLYSIIPALPWYALILIFINVVGISTIFFSILDLTNNFLRAILFLILFPVCWSFLVIFFQFTIVSFIAVISGITLFLSSSIGNRLSISRLIASITLVIIGGGIRMHPACLSVIVVTPIILFLGGSFGKRFILGCGVGLALIMLIDLASYKLDYKWENYYSYNWVHGSLYETPVMRGYSNNKEVFKSVKWSENDFDMFNSASVQNESTFSYQKLLFLFQNLQKPSVITLFWAFIAYLLRYPHLTGMFILWIGCAYGFRLLSRTAILLLAIPHISIGIYLIVVARLPERVLIPMFLLQFCLLLLLSKFPKVIKNSFYIAPASLMLLILHIIMIIYSLKLYAPAVIFNQERKASTALAFQSLSENGPITVINCVAGTAIEQTSVWGNFSELKNINIFELDWSFPGPVYYQRLKSLGLTDPFLDLATKDNLYLGVSVWDIRKVLYIERFLKEHYNLNVEFTIAKIPGTDKDAVFPFFTLYKAHPISNTSQVIGASAN